MSHASEHGTMSAMLEGDGRHGLECPVCVMKAVVNDALNVLLVAVQEMVDENQDKKWECPECSSMRAERRSLAAQRARLKRSSQGKAIARSVLSLSTWEARGKREGGGGRVRAGASVSTGETV